jgi:hypothetical protein
MISDLFRLETDPCPKLSAVIDLAVTNRDTGISLKPTTQKPRLKS